VALLRVVVGVIFVWAGLSKVFNEGAPGSWSAQGFLKFATNGSLGWPFVTGTADPTKIYNPTHDFWVSLAGNATAMTIVNNLVVAGEMCVGIALLLGVVTRFAGVMGAFMMAFFFLAGWSFTDGIVEEHVTYAVILWRWPVWARATTSASIECSALASRPGSDDGSCRAIRTHRRQLRRPIQPSRSQFMADGMRVHLQTQQTRTE